MTVHIKSQSIHNRGRMGHDSPSSCTLIAHVLALIMSFHRPCLLRMAPSPRPSSGITGTFDRAGRQLAWRSFSIPAPDGPALPSPYWELLAWADVIFLPSTFSAASISSIWAGVSFRAAFFSIPTKCSISSGLAG
jgi:hypothetical protein